MTDLFFTNLSQGIRPNVKPSDESEDLTSPVGGGGPNIYRLTTARGTGVVQLGIITQAGPHTAPGLGLQGANTPALWVSNPVAAAVTFDGYSVMSMNLWAVEGSMSANAAIGCVVWKVTPSQSWTKIGTMLNTTELGTSAAMRSSGTTPVGSLGVGDVIVVEVFFDDASSGNMGQGYTADFDYNGSSVASDGDSYIIFSNTITFASTPGGSTLETSQTTSDLGNDATHSRYELWIDVAGASGYTATTASTATDPVEITTSNGSGVNVEFVTPQLQAVDITGYASISIRSNESSDSANQTLMAGLYKCDADGSNEVTLGIGLGASELAVSPGASQSTFYMQVNGSLTDGQRLVLKLFNYHPVNLTGSAGYTTNVTYGLDTPNWTIIVLPVTVSEYSSAQTIYASVSFSAAADFTAAADHTLHAATLAVSAAATFTPAAFTGRAATLTVSAASTFTAAAYGVRPATVAFTSAATFTTAGTVVKQGSVTMSAAAAFTIAAYVQRFATVSYSAVSTFTIEGVRIATATVAYTATATFTAEGTVAGGVVQATLAVAAAASLAVAGYVVAAATVSMTATATFTAVGVPEKQGALTVTAAATFTVTGITVRPASVSMSAAATLTVAAFVQRFATVAFTAASTFTAVGSLTVTVTLSVSAAATFTASGAVTVQLALSCVAAATFVVAGAVTVQLGVTMTAASTFTIAGAVTVQLALSLTAASTFTIAAGIERAATVAFAAVATFVAEALVWRFGMYKPDGLAGMSGFSGTYLDIDESPDTPDGNALVPTGGPCAVRITFENHNQQMRTGTGDQILRVLVHAL